MRWSPTFAWAKTYLLEALRNLDSLLPEMSCLGSVEFALRTAKFTINSSRAADAPILIKRGQCTLAPADAPIPNRLNVIKVLYRAHSLILPCYLFT